MDDTSLDKLCKKGHAYIHEFEAACKNNKGIEAAVFVGRLQEILGQFMVMAKIAGTPPINERAVIDDGRLG